MGSLEVITGVMFSGKTEELLRRAKRVMLAKQKILLFKPAIDIRYAQDSIVSHNGISLPCHVTKCNITVDEIEQFGDADVYAFDEAQFYSSSFLKLINHEISLGKRIICSGLDLDFLGEPFGIMPQLLALADKVDKLTAICPLCGKEATRTQRVFNGSPVTNGKVIVVGGAGTYEPRCKDCFVRPN